MRNIYLTCVCSVLAIVFLDEHILANPVAKSVLREVLETVLRKESKSALSKSAMDGMEKTMVKYAATHGTETITKLTTTGGTNFLRGLERYGDEFLELSTKLSDDGVKVFSRNSDHLVPLAKKFGPELVELEAKSPGVSSFILKQYGPESLPVFAKEVAAKDIPLLLQAAERAQDKAAKDLLLKTYAKEGRSFLEKIPPKLVIAVGAGGGLVFIGKGLGDGASKTGNGIEKGIHEIGISAGEYVKPLYIGLHGGSAFSLPHLWLLLRGLHCQNTCITDENCII